MNIFDTLEQTAQHYPKQVAVIDDFGEISYHELAEGARVLKAWLIESGVEPGQGVAVITSNSRYFMLCLYAAVGAGAVVMPVSEKLTPIEIDTSLEEGEMHYVIGDKNPFAAQESGTESWAYFPHKIFLTKTTTDPGEQTAGFLENPAFIRFSSGTTGKAKGVVISHEAVYERIEAANQLLKLSSTDRVIWVLPMAYHFVVSICLYIDQGVGIIIDNSFSAKRLTDKILSHRGTFLYASPMHIKLMASHKDAPKLPTLKRVISTTAGITEEICNSFFDVYHLPVSQAYGIIEIGLPIMNLDQSRQHPLAIGHALPAYTVGILDEDFKQLPDGEAGLLGIIGPGMFAGYLNPPTPREEVLQGGWFITGDIAVRNSEGLLTIKGRKKNMINVSGMKVFPNEVERVLNTHPEVRLAKAYGRNHPLLGEVVAVDLVPEEGYSPDVETLIRYCKQYLSGFKVPQFVRLVKEIEMTGSGKIKRA